MYYLAHMEEKKRKCDETVSVRARNYPFTQRFPEIFSFKRNLYPFFCFFMTKKEIWGIYAVWASWEMFLGYAIIFFFRLLQPAPGWVSNLWCLVSQDITKRQEAGSRGDDLSDGFRVCWVWFSQFFHCSCWCLVYKTSALSLGDGLLPPWHLWLEKSQHTLSKLSSPT